MPLTLKKKIKALRHFIVKFNIYVIICNKFQSGSGMSIYEILGPIWGPIPNSNKRPMGHIAHLSNTGSYENTFRILIYISFPFAPPDSQEP
jgi:hypothetical protein